MSVAPQYLSPSAGTQFQKIVNVTATLGNQTVPIYSFRIETGAYGMIGRATFTTSIAALQANSISIDTLNASTVLQNYTPLQIYVNGQLIFGGYYFFGHYSFHDDTAEIAGRDYAAPLFDAKRSLAAYNYQNATVESLIQQIATQFQITSFDFRPQSNPNVGTIINTQLAGSVDATRPQPLWNYLVLLAKFSGSQIYVDPYGTLHLIGLNLIVPSSINAGTSGTAAASQALFTPHTYYWQPIPGNAQQPTTTQVSQVLPQQQGNQVPVMKLDILHQPQRNKNFAVVVMSHHQGTTQTAYSQVVFMGESITTATGTIAARKYTGSGGALVRSVLSSRNLGIPTYYKWIDGQTPSQIAAAAEALGNFIASHLFVYTGQVDGDTSLMPLCQIWVYELPTASVTQPLIGFSGYQLTCQSVIHSFNTPQGDSMGGDESGFVSTFKATALPPTAASEADVVSAVSAGAGAGGE